MEDVVKETPPPYPEVAPEPTAAPSAPPAAPTALPVKESTYIPGPSTFDTPHGRVFNPQYRPMQQHATNVTVVSQPTITPAVVAACKPPDYMILSILTCFFCNWICGGIAIFFSAMVISDWSAGRVESAQQHSKNAKIMNIVAIVFGSISLVAYIVLTVVRVQNLNNQYNQ